MPSKSKSQQNLMKMVYAYKKGKLKKDDIKSKSLWNKIKNIAKDMPTKDAKDFATKRENLNKIIKEEIKKIKLNELFSSNLNNYINDSDKELLRKAIIAELDAISLYKKFSNIAKNNKIKKTFLSVAKEEKTHVGEFQSLLKLIDKEYSTELKNGSKEVENI
jgi:hypothetical protein